MIRSIRLTLTFWYIGILAVILCLFGGVLYTRVVTKLSQDIDEILDLHTDAVSEALFSFWQAEKEITPSYETIEEEVNQGRFSSLVTRWARETGELEARPIRIIDRENQPLCSSKSFTQLNLPLTGNAMNGAGRGQAVYETFHLEDYRVRLITRPIVEGEHTLYFVQAAAPLIQLDSSLRRLRLWLLGLVPLTLLITSLGGWFLAAIALRPIGQMIRQVGQISAVHLQKRIDIPSTGDELERLAIIFNEMLTRIERSFQRLRQFSAAASHELRTPLTVMKGELEVALRKPRDEEEYRRVLQTHLGILNEMVRIVEELLTLARGEAGSGAVEWKRVELGALVQKVNNAWQMVAEAKSIHVETLIKEEVWVYGEQRLLERLLSNLLDNAIKNTSKNECVIIRSIRRENEACLIVQDNGPGISSEELPKIFDRFFSKRGSADAEHSSGFGLGLCRWIAEIHRGRIEVSSTPGEGATFTVFFPLSTD